jgi:hypothetical protein
MLDPIGLYNQQMEILTLSFERARRKCLHDATQKLAGNLMKIFDVVRSHLGIPYVSAKTENSRMSVPGIH